MTDNSMILGDSSLKAFLADLIYPNRCPFCSRFIRYDRLCCEECFSEILWADENICRLCGKPLAPRCRCEEKPGYDMCAAAAYYSGSAKKGIINLKYRGGLNAAVIFGRVLRDELKLMDVWDGITAAVPVPMSVKQQRQRGYNQAEELAYAVTEGSDIKVRNDLIFRKYSKIAQHTLNAAERKTAAQNAYFAKSGEKLPGGVVLLVDDVLTTGATFDKCAELLKELGAQKVICAAAATVSE